MNRTHERVPPRKEQLRTLVIMANVIGLAPVMSGVVRMALLEEKPLPTSHHRFLREMEGLN